MMIMKKYTLVKANKPKMFQNFNNTLSNSSMERVVIDKSPTNPQNAPPPNQLELWPNLSRILPKLCSSIARMLTEFQAFKI